MNFQQAFFDEMTKAAFAIGAKERAAREDWQAASRKAYADEDSKTLNEKRKAHRNTALKRVIGGTAAGALGGAALGALADGGPGALLGGSVGGHLGSLGGMIAAANSLEAAGRRSSEWQRRKREMGEDALDS